MQQRLSSMYSGKTVLVTGHTGFKGSWLSAWLVNMGANVIGYALDPETDISHFELLNIDMVDIRGDVRDLDLLKKTFQEHRPEIVFHLAAQPLVRLSYDQPIETYDTNVMGTLKVLEAARSLESVKAIINITSDKCYENREWDRGYIESDHFGGYDPYSSSKGCSEILTSSYRRSYFNNNDYNKSHNTLLASARAGNVVGGGDWALDRLIPDFVRAAVKNEPVSIRNPKSTRPWQHVLEPLSGYLQLGVKLLEEETQFASGWNFGPEDESCVEVKVLLENLKKHWNGIEYRIEAEGQHEAGFLKLDSTKAKSELMWKPTLNIDETLKMTAEWYREFYNSKQLLTYQQIDKYTKTL